jgi:hypothetical protein
MISFITGKPGGGKGLLSMDQHVDELVLGTRPLITSLPVRLEPWVNGSWKPMCGTKSFLSRTYPKQFGTSEKLAEIDKRVFVLNDEQAQEFFLYRVIDGKLVKAEAVYKTSKDGEKRLMEYDTSLAAKSGPTFYCIDEAWKFWGSRNWQKTGEGMLFYGAQHRHFGDDVLVVTQHTKQIDPAIQRVAQDFWVVRNHGKMTFGMFRQPAVFSVCIYDQPPTGASISPMSRKMFTLDRTGLAQCYDTSAGVGLSGRMMADIGGRTKGLPWWVGVVGVLGALFLIYYAIVFSAKMVTHGMLKAGPGAARHVEHAMGQNLDTNGHPVVAGPIKRELSRTESVRHFQTQDSDEEVVCRGYDMCKGQARVYLSNGQIFDSRYGEVDKVLRHSVIIQGVEYPIKPDWPKMLRLESRDVSSFPAVDGISPESAGESEQRSKIKHRSNVDLSTLR